MNVLFGEQNALLFSFKDIEATLFQAHPMDDLHDLLDGKSFLFEDAQTDLATNVLGNLYRVSPYADVATMRRLLISHATMRMRYMLSDVIPPDMQKIRILRTPSLLFRIPAEKEPKSPVGLDSTHQVGLSSKNYESGMFHMDALAISTSDVNQANALGFFDIQFFFGMPLAKDSPLLSKFWMNKHRPEFPKLYYQKSPLQDEGIEQLARISSKMNICSCIFGEWV